MAQIGSVAGAVALTLAAASAAGIAGIIGIAVVASSTLHALQTRIDSSAASTCQSGQD